MKTIGILDSGVGGLTVWKEIVLLLPQVSTVYVADSLNAPYGSKSPEEIYALGKKLILFLLKKKVDLIVIACNAITTNCLEKLRQDFPRISIVGTVPAIKKAGEMSEMKRIGIFSTTATAKSDYQTRLMDQFALDCDILNVGTDDLVPLIEKGIVEGPEIGAILKRSLQPFSEEPVDVLVLGCTHYPLIRKEIAAVMDEEVEIIDSGAAIARQVKRLLEEQGTFVTSSMPTYAFYTSGNKKLLQAMLAKLDMPDLLGTAKFYTYAQTHRMTHST